MNHPASSSASAHVNAPTGCKAIDSFIASEREEEFVYCSAEASNVASALRNLASFKVKDVPTYVKSSHSKEKVMQDTWSWLFKYNEKYVQIGSIRPLTGVMVSIRFLYYAVAWPTEIRHLRHAEEAAKHGNAHQ